MSLLCHFYFIFYITTYVVFYLRPAEHVLVEHALVCAFNSLMLKTWFPPAPNFITLSRLFNLPNFSFLICEKLKVILTTPGLDRY